MPNDDLTFGPIAMLYYQFAVAPARTHPNFTNLGYGLASVMLRLDDEDISTCTVRAVEYLAAEHWNIVEIRQARLVDSRENVEDDGRLGDLFEEAQASGIAGLLVAPGAGVYALRGPDNSRVAAA